jgi:hypothetical protein
MRNLKPLEPGVMFWAERDSLEEIGALGVRCADVHEPCEPTTDHFSFNSFIHHQAIHNPAPVESKW